ncbi:MAG: magnesium/cobalt transporter CorA [Thermoclostridium sp.]|nr:magnesium/cobalt transporter CorA [Thermoclostridium sp.]
MVYTLALTEGLDLLTDAAMARLQQADVHWYWVDINVQKEEDLNILRETFHFHHLAVTDCSHTYERAKVDFYDAYNFFVLNTLRAQTLTTVDLNLFVGNNYVVSVHKGDMTEVNQVRERLIQNDNIWAEGHLYITYLLFDKVVDQYFPALHQIEDKLNRINIHTGMNTGQSVIKKVFSLREELLKLRRVTGSMKELLYRMINSEHLQSFHTNKHYFNNIYDHLIRLSEAIESNREMTADMRDSYLSINSHQMNRIMTILTIITSIFIPLTFIAGIYGMNFHYMPELRWKYGYFIILGVMVAIGVGMFLWFKIKGWFNIYK